jgi:hypothetical protein
LPVFSDVIAGLGSPRRHYVMYQIIGRRPLKNLGCQQPCYKRESVESAIAMPDDTITCANDQWTRLWLEKDGL